MPDAPCPRLMHNPATTWWVLLAVGVVAAMFLLVASVPFGLQAFVCRCALLMKLGCSEMAEGVPHSRSLLSSST